MTIKNFDIELATRLYVDEGLGLKAVSRAVGNSQQFVTQRLRKAGVEIRRSNKPDVIVETTPERVSRAKALYLSGLSTSAVASKMGVSQNRVKVWLKEANVELRRGGPGRRTGETAGTNGNTDGVFKGHALKEFEKQAIALQPITIRCGCGWNVSGLQGELVGAFDAHPCQLRTAA